MNSVKRKSSQSARRTGKEVLRNIIMKQKVQKNNSLKKYYDSISSVYDEASRSKMFSWNAPKMIEKTIKDFVTHSMNVLDLGIGTGQSSEYFDTLSAKITGIDISNKSISLAKKKHPQWHLISANIEHRFPNFKSCFNVVVACGVLEFVSNVRKVFIQTKNVLCQNGLFIFTIEEYISGSKLQSHKTAPLNKGIKNSSPFSDFIVYRRTAKEIKDILKELQMDIVIHKRFIGYYKTKKRIPIYYSLFLVKNHENF